MSDVVFKAQVLKNRDSIECVFVHHLVLTHEPIESYMGKSVNYVKFFANTAQTSLTAENVAWWKFQGFPQYLFAPEQCSYHFKLHEEDHRQPLVAENAKPIGKLLERQMHFKHERNFDVIFVSE